MYICMLRQRNIPFYFIFFPRPNRFAHSLQFVFLFFSFPFSELYSFSCGLNWGDFYIRYKTRHLGTLTASVRATITWNNKFNTCELLLNILIKVSGDFFEFFFLGNRGNSHATRWTRLRNPNLWRS